MLKMTLGLTILGLCLSTLHQSSLGALFLMMPHRVHPLWYSGYVPIFFFVSAIAAGLSMVIVEGGLAHRFFPGQIDHAHHEKADTITLGLAQGGGGRPVRLLLPEAAGPRGRRADGPPAHRLRLLVPVRDVRLRRRAVRPVRRRRAAPQRNACALGGRLDGDRHRRQPAQPVGHHVQLERRQSATCRASSRSSSR